MTAATLSHLVGEALRRGYRTIAYRDPQETDLLREVARMVSKIRAIIPSDRRIAVVLDDRAGTATLKADLMRYGITRTGRIGLNNEAIQVGSLARLERRIARGDEPYGLIILLEGLDRSRIHRLLTQHSAVWVIDADPRGGPGPRPPDHVLFRDPSGDLQSLQDTGTHATRH